MGQRPTVAILFHDAAIASLFAELTRAQGAIAQVIYSGPESSKFDKVITETRYIKSIPETLHQNTLVVTNGENCDFVPTTLRRPLTETKVLEALSNLLPQ